MCKTLAVEGFRPVTLDNLSTGHRHAVQWGPLIECDLLDAAGLAEAFARFDFAAVFHFAALSDVGQSVTQRSRYVRNNVEGTAGLLHAMLSAGVRRLVFSSSAAVYGIPLELPITEQSPCNPINPYGESKLAAERLIEGAARNGLRSACLRYFNAIGGDPDGDIGELHEPETHLIPSLVRAAFAEPPRPARLHGSDYQTPDGTCIRDFVDVNDLCRAHLSALDYLELHPGKHCFNLGSGTGQSVLEVLRAVREACGGYPLVEVGPRRIGDPPILIADIEKARSKLGWVPEVALADSIRHSVGWLRGTGPRDQA